MNVPDPDAHSVAAFRRFYQLLPRDADQALLILKLHLLVEEQVRAYVDERLQNAKSLEAARLDCHAAICLAEALCGDDIHPRVWEAARKLNELRNQVAHKLEPAGIQKRVDTICELIGLNLKAMAAVDGPFPPEAMDNFIFAVAMLHGEVSLFVKRKPASVVHLVPPSSVA